jgi:hypothetical protein
MVRTCTGDFALDEPEAFGVRGGAAPIGPRGIAPTSPPPPMPPPPPMSIKQLLATQNELMQVLMENLTHRGGHQPHHPPVLDSCYTNFLVTHPPTFAEVSNPLEADNWLHITESKFGFLHYTKFQKTICGPAASWARQCLVG